MIAKLEKYFEFAALGTNWRTEVLAGFTTFITMAYIVVVNPAILHEAGMPLAAVTAATCISAAIGSILMGVLARYPIALAPGMGLNAYFTYSVVKGMGVPWQTALGAVFVSGVVFVLLTVTGLRQKILKSIPHELYPAVAGGIGLFIAFIGLKNAGIIVANSSTMISLGNVRSPDDGAGALWHSAGCRVAGLAGARRHADRHRRHRAQRMDARACPLASHALQPLVDHRDRLQTRSARRVCISDYSEIIFVFLFVDLFDNLGTLVAVTKKAGLIKDDHEIPRVDRILLADAIATVCGSLVGTSTVTSYVESAAGVAAGGRSGVAAIVTGILFHRGALHRAVCGSAALGGDRARTNRRGFADAVDNQRNLLARSTGGVSGVSHADHDSVDVLDRQRTGFWDDRLRGAAVDSRALPEGRLAAVCAGIVVSAAIYLYGEELKGVPPRSGISYLTRLAGAMTLIVQLGIISRS